MQRYNILWADDEIDLLKPHILFLTKKGYDITPVNSGADALDKIKEAHFDLIFLDENMPGMTGLETLEYIKATDSHTPIVMITKSEEEHIMEEAIGAKIADYLIKPLNPNQILLAAKKILQRSALVTEKTNRNYQQEFRTISTAFSENMNFQEWADVYKKLIYWELEIENTIEQSMEEVIEMQKNEANTNFSKFIMAHYESWLSEDVPAPILSHDLMYEKVFPHLQPDKPLFFVLMDNLRFDQWRILAPIVNQYFNITEESTYYSILPTTTAYARNAIFSGLTPKEMKEYHPEYWGDEIEGTRNNHEKEFLKIQLEEYELPIKFSYNKVIHANQGKSLVDNFKNLTHNQFNAIVYNFVDMLSHARTDMNMIRELAPDEGAYRSLTKSWFLHSPCLEMLKLIAEHGYKLILTTDHGTIRAKRPYKIIGDRNTNTNLRYKHGKNLNYDERSVFIAKDPERMGLPKSTLTSSYVFATEDFFFAYPNNYNHYVKYYRDTFQHGGISMEEVIVPFVVLEPK